MKSFQQFNLVPESTRLEFSFQQLIRSWGSVFGLTLFGILLLIFWQAIELQASREFLAERSQDHNPIRELLTNISRTEALSRSRTQELDKMETLTAGPKPIEILGALAAACRGGKSPIVISSLSSRSDLPKTPIQAASTPNQKLPPQEMETILTLQAIIYDDEDIPLFLNHLKRTGLFTDVNLQSAAREAQEDRSQHQISIQARIVTEVQP